MSHITTSTDKLDARDAALNEIADALRDLRFVSIVVTVHDGVVVQIDRTEKRRLPAMCSSSPTTRSC